MKIQLIVLLLLTLLTAGCAHHPTTPEEVKKASLELSQKFARGLQGRDFSGAYALTSTEFQSRLSQTQMKGNYDDARYKYATNPDKVTVTAGTLPDAAAGLKRRFPEDVPAQNWRAWMVARLDQAGKRGFEARLLIIDDNGQFKVGHIEYGPVP